MIQQKTVLLPLFTFSLINFSLISVDRLTKLLIGFPSIKVPKDNSRENFFWWPKGQNFGFDSMKNGYFTENEINSLLNSEGWSLGITQKNHFHRFFIIFTGLETYPIAKIEIYNIIFSI